jgi:hypothetical protein
MTKMKLADQDFKTIINVFKELRENMNITNK